MDAPSATPVPPRPKRGWLRRNWLWFVPTALVGLFVACAGCCGGIGLYVLGQWKSAEPYQMALKLVQQDAKVKAALGEPVEEATWWRPPGGEIHIEDGRGDARYTFEVKGPRGTAQVQSQARRMDGQWSLTLLDVTIDRTGERIAVETSSTSQFDEAPRWKP